MTTENVSAPENEEDPFAAAFAEAIAGTEASPVKKEEPVLDAAAQKVADDAAAAQKVADDAAAAEAAAREAETPEQTKAREDAAAATKKAEEDAEAKRKADEVLANSPAMIAAATAKALVTAQADAAAETEAKKRADDEAATKAAADKAKRELTAEEVTELDGLKTEWKDIARLFELKFKENSGLAQTAQGEAMKAMLEHIYADIQPIALSQKELQETQHFSDINAAHKDFEAVHPKLLPWIETQPGYLQKALKEVYTGGTAGEVIDLVQRYKDASGIVSPKADDVTPAPTTKKSEPDPKKVAALAPVDSQRSQVQDKGIDKNNFEAGWDEAIALASKK